MVAASNGELPSYQFQEKSWLRSSSSGYQTRWTKRSWRNKWGSGKERVAPTRFLLFKHHQVTHRAAVYSIHGDSLLYWILQQIFHHYHHHHHFISHFRYSIYTAKQYGRARRPPRNHQAYRGGHPGCLYVWNWDVDVDVRLGKFVLISLRNQSSFF